MRFAYLSFDRQGMPSPGEIDAASAGEAREVLRQRGLYVTEMREAAGVGGDPALVWRGGNGGFGRGKRLQHLAGFTRQLHVLVASGTPLVQALGALERQARDASWKAVIVDV